MLWLLGIALLAIAAVVAEERRGVLNVGTKAPDFTATLSSGSSVSLSEYHGKKNVVLFFYPKDFTAGCTDQVCSLRDGYGELSRFDAVMIGVSADSAGSHELFRTTHSLPFELVCDVDRSLIKAFGVERLAGCVRLPKRVTYVIDKEGIIRLAAHHELLIGKHREEVLSVLASLDGRTTEESYRNVRP